MIAKNQMLVGVGELFVESWDDLDAWDSNLHDVFGSNHTVSGSFTTASNRLEVSSFGSTSGGDSWSGPVLSYELPDLKHYVFSFSMRMTTTTSADRGKIRVEIGNSSDVTGTGQVSVMIDSDTGRGECRNILGDIVGDPAFSDSTTVGTGTYDVDVTFIRNGSSFTCEWSGDFSGSHSGTADSNPFDLLVIQAVKHQSSGAVTMSVGKITLEY